jgi:hypothetical protein
MDELRRWLQFGIGPDRPLAVVNIEFGRHIGQVDIRLPIGVDGSDIAPIGFILHGRAHAGFGEAVRHGFAVLDDIRMMSLPKSRLEFGSAASRRRRPSETSSRT